MRYPLFLGALVSTLAACGAPAADEPILLLEESDMASTQEDMPSTPEKADMPAVDCAMITCEAGAQCDPETLACVPKPDPCEAGSRMCGGSCAACPQDLGVGETTCAQDDRCVIEHCAQGFRLCGSGCCDDFEAFDLVRGVRARAVDIVIDGEQIPHIVAVQDEILFYATVQDEQWVTSTIYANNADIEDVHLRLDSQGRAHVLSYDENATYQLKYYKHQGGDRWEEHITDFRATPDEERAHYNLELDSADRPHFLYRDSEQGDALVHAYLDESGTWQRDRLPTFKYKHPFGEHPFGATGAHVLVLGPQDTLNVAFTANDGKALAWAKKEGSGWSARFVVEEDEDYVQLYSFEAVVGPQGAPHIAYQRLKRTSLTTWNKTLHYVGGSAWSKTALETEPASWEQGEIALTVAGDGQPHIVYSLDGVGARYAYRHEGGWGKVDIASGQAGGVAISTSPFRVPHIALNTRSRFGGGSLSLYR